jgi:hypothetical protein
MDQRDIVGQKFIYIDRYTDDYPGINYQGIVVVRQKDNCWYNESLEYFGGIGYFARREHPTTRSDRLCPTRIATLLLRAGRKLPHRPKQLQPSSIPSLPLSIVLTSSQWCLSLLIH